MCNSQSYLGRMSQKGPDQSLTLFNKNKQTTPPKNRQRMGEGYMGSRTVRTSMRRGSWKEREKGGEMKSI